MRKSITLISGSLNTKRTLENQLKEYLEDVVDINSYAIDDGIKNNIKDELIVVSSSLAYDELKELNIIDKDCEIIIANRTIDYNYIEKLVLLPHNTDILFVNDLQESCVESIEALNRIGIDYLNFIPYYPGSKVNFDNIKIAITPGEVDKVPKSIETVYNIGPRIMDFTTITKILNKLDILDEKAGNFSEKFLRKIINLGKKLAKSSNQILDLNQHLNLVIDSLNDGLLVYNNQGYTSVFNENLKKILKIQFDRIIGKNIKDIIYNKKLLEFLMDKTENKKILNIYDKDIIVSKFQIIKSDSIIVIFKEPNGIVDESLVRKELFKKGFYAKYTFEDIIGDSFAINNIKNISRKLAETEITILIEGESGTGKELFASSIHNASKRKEGPFLAVNFSALPDELIESELFGYEEGSFTGAKRGGKAGLFEQADGGTIFLDEIGDISHKLQARLLRVLQEKEVMRIGGTDIKIVDVRIIGATNKNLAKLVKEKKFREDLYFRLKMGYIKLPSLRERKEDIFKLMNYFIKVENTQNITISNDVIEELIKYNWYGNVRELKNILAYMLAVRENNTITLKDIPNEGFFMKELHEDFVEDKIVNRIELDAEYTFILNKIDFLIKKGELVGRERLSLETIGTKYEMTKYQMRSRLDKLENLGLIIKKKGKHGTIITNKGKELLMGLMVNGHV